MKNSVEHCWSCLRYINWASGGQATALKEPTANARIKLEQECFSLPLVSIIIPCHNYGKDGFLSESIKSALNQTYKNIEVIVIDDDSTDNSQQVAQSFKGVKCYRIKHQGMKTPAHASNFGMTVAHGKFLIFLAADDKLERHYVSFCVKRLVEENDPKQVGFVWTGCQAFGDRHHIDMPRRKRLTKKTSYAYYGGQIGASLIPKYAYDVVGGYDETLEGCEDYDWVLRALNKNFVGLSVSAPLHFYRYHGKSVNSNAQNKNIHFKVLKKYHPILAIVYSRIRLDRMTTRFRLFFFDNAEFRWRLYRKAMRGLHGNQVEFNK